MFKTAVATTMAIGSAATMTYLTAKPAPFPAIRGRNYWFLPANVYVGASFKPAREINVYMTATKEITYSVRANGEYTTADIIHLNISNRDHEGDCPLSLTMCCFDSTRPHTSHVLNAIPRWR